MEHTPGPWTAEGIRHMPNSNIHIVAKNHLGEIVANDNHSIAICAGPDKRANARLIAAAPMLLEALKGVSNNAHTEDEPCFCKHMEFTVIDSEMPHQAQCIKARAALAAAGVPNE